jgi:hypothetical protein
MEPISGKGRAIARVRLTMDVRSVVVRVGSSACIRASLAATIGKCSRPSGETSP